MTTEIKERIARIRRGEIPDGYKRTKSGIIPNGWESQALRTLCDINPKRNGDTPSKVTFLGMSDTDGNGRIISQHIVPYETVCRGYTPFLRGDILVAKITPCFENGKGAYTENLQTECGFGSTEFHVLRRRPGVSGAYLFFHTQSQRFRNALQTEMTGTAGQKRVQTPSIASYCVPCPPLAEQRKIAAILSAQDRLIELQERLIAEKRRQKKWLAQRLLTGKQRPPGFYDTWKTDKLKSVLNPGNKRPVDTSQYRKITVKLRFGGLEFANVSRAMADARPFYVRNENEIIIGKQNYFNGSVALVTKEYAGCICSNAIMSFAVRDANAAFVLAYISQPDFLNRYAMLANGTGQKELSESDFLNFDISLPSLAEQTAIADILSAADREINLLQRGLEEEKRKKNALSQLLLTGIARV